MAEKLEDTVKLLIEEGRKKGSLTYSEMNRLLEDQFVPPDRMDAVFVALEDAGVDVLDDAEAAVAAGDKDPADEVAVEAEEVEHDDDLPDMIFPRQGLPEKIDDPVRMYLTQ